MAEMLQGGEQAGGWAVAVASLAITSWVLKMWVSDRNGGSIRSMIAELLREVREGNEKLARAIDLADSTHSQVRAHDKDAREMHRDVREAAQAQATASARIETKLGGR
jgi:hypothetical protein